MFNMSAYNRAVTENMPIITVEGWEDVHPLLKLIPPPIGMILSPSAYFIRRRLQSWSKNLSIF